MGTNVLLSKIVSGDVERRRQYCREKKRKDLISVLGKSGRRNYRRKSEALS